MKYHVKVRLAFNRLKRRYRVGADRGLFQVAGLIRLEAKQGMKRRGKTNRARRGRFRRTGQRGSPKGTPPFAYTSQGLKQINFDVRWPSALIGPRKFKRSKFFDQPVPAIHEKGLLVVAAGSRRKKAIKYPERSFMWSAVKSLERKGKIQSRFNVTLSRSW